MTVGATQDASGSPGRILLEDLKDEGISINGLAQAIRVPANRISLIVNEKRGITADTAARNVHASYRIGYQGRLSNVGFRCAGE